MITETLIKTLDITFQTALIPLHTLTFSVDLNIYIYKNMLIVENMEKDVRFRKSLNECNSLNVYLFLYDLVL